MKQCDRGEEIFEPDGIHLSFAGYRLMTRAILDALGYPGVPVPEDQDLHPLPGIVEHWRLRGAPVEPLTASAAKAVAEADTQGLGDGDGWAQLMLPSVPPTGLWWTLSEARRGFAVGLERVAGPAERYHGFAKVTSESDRTAILNAGAGLQAAWLNGVKVYHQEGFHGWRAGRDRVPVTLNRGENRLVIETSGDFFVSITDDNEW